MYKIGEFSKLSLTTIKALRFYEKKGLLMPSFIDEYTGYRYYDSEQLSKISSIKYLSQIGFSINEIKSILSGEDLQARLQIKKQQIINKISQSNYQLRTINYILEEKDMSYQAFIKKLPKCVVYYEERVLDDYSQITNLVLESAEECTRINPNVECLKPDYCFMEYLDGEYKEKNILARYSQAVVKAGKENERIHFKELEETDAICIYHKGDYSKLGDAYSYIINFAKANGYEMNGCMREVYIDGCWNKESTDEYLTEIQMPISTISK